MSSADLIAALDLPAAARVDQRVPKKLLVEHGPPTTSARRQINEGVAEVHWLAALKPTTIGVPVFRDMTREYLEIAVLSAGLRPDAKALRVSELIHRTIPYPVFLIASQGDALALSLVHKRWSQGDAGATVLDGTLIVADLEVGQSGEFWQPFLNALPIARQPHSSLYALYQGWMDTLVTLLAARVTGVFAATDSPQHTAARRVALVECSRLEAHMGALRAAAAKERQIPRQVELNLELQRLLADFSAAKAKL